MARGRDPGAGQVPELLREPPDDLPPALVGVVVDEQADVQDVVATLVDLARRGKLRIVAGEPQRIAGRLLARHNAGCSAWGAAQQPAARDPGLNVSFTYLHILSRTSDSPQPRLSYFAVGWPAWCTCKHWEARATTGSDRGRQVQVSGVGE